MVYGLFSEETEVEGYEIAGSMKVRTYYINDCLEVIVENKISGTKAAAAIMEGEREILLSDKTISAFQIVLEDGRRCLAI